MASVEAELIQSAIDELRDAQVVLSARYYEDVGRVAVEADEHLECAQCDLGSVKHHAMAAVRQVRAALRAGVSGQADLDAQALRCQAIADAVMANAAAHTNLRAM
jgi:predicted nucleotide-binding protein (sugar kinase/HSP70/actin superfamily)